MCILSSALANDFMGKNCEKERQMKDDIGLSFLISEKTHMNG